MSQLSPLVMDARAFLRKLTKEGTIMVFVREGLTGELIMRACKGPEPDLSAGSATRTILDQLERDGKPALIMDAAQDARFKNMEPRFRAALAVVIPGSNGRTVGLLYADDEAPGAFSYGNRSEAEEFAREMGEKLQDVDWGTPKKAANENKQARAPLMAAGGVLLLALIWGLVGARITMTTPEATPTAAPVTTTQQAEPLVLARSFLNLLQTRDFEASYRLLSSRLRESVSREDFKAAMQSWVSEGSHAWGLQYRDPVVVDQTGGYCALRLQAVGPAAGQEDWSWNLVSEDQGWRLDSVNGGPPVEGSR